MKKVYLIVLTIILVSSTIYANSFIEKKANLQNLKEKKVSQIKKSEVAQLVSLFSENKPTYKKEDFIIERLSAENLVRIIAADTSQITKEHREKIEKKIKDYIHLSKSKIGEERLFAREQLERLGTTGEAQILTYLESEDNAIAEICAKTIIKNQNTEIKKKLLNRLKDKSVSELTKMKIIFIFGQLKDKKYLKEIDTFSNDSSEKIRKMARQAVNEINSGK